LKLPPENAETFSAFLDRLGGALQELPHQHQLAFAASCCERAYPNYVDFSDRARWGDAQVLRHALDTVWAIVDGSGLNADQLLSLEKKCRQVTPDLDDFSSPDIDVQCAAGQEAAFMVILLLQFCRDEQPHYAVRIATFARDTIDMYVQVIEQLDPADPQLEDKIAQHRITVAELQKQNEDLAALRKIKTSADLRQFIKHSIAPGRSNIGLAQCSGPHSSTRP
jgi:uncharacterized protein YjaG (DUF416 family)